MYIYRADTWCDSCGEAIKSIIEKRGEKPEDTSDERYYDSDEWPKSADGEDETDSPMHCGAHETCLEAEKLTDGSKVGALLGITLTPDGVQYVREAIAEGGLVAEFWKEQFRDYDLEGENNDH